MRSTIISAVCLLFGINQVASNILVQVSQGTLNGTFEQNEYGGSFYSFKGIPYAQPPIGDLRFKAPQPPTPWNGVRSAAEVGPACFQINLLSGETETTGSEDCLYLNVYTPDLEPAEPLPVMFWIHGGGFFSGTGGDLEYGPEFLVRKDVVLVAINYRLDILGFLSLDIEEVPGNAGLKDQVAALRWVRDNIKKFGGDPEMITIFGESAGGASVAYHLMSPMSKGLFKRAITQSGSPIAHWPLIIEPREKAISFARQLNFTSTDPHEIHEFLKSLPVETIVRLDVPVTIDEQAIIPMSTNFAAVSEKTFGDNEFFLTGDVFESLHEEGIHEDVEVMSGYTEHEGIFGLLIRGMFENVSKYGEFLEFFCPTELRYHCTKKQILEIGRKMRNHYINDSLFSEENIWGTITYLSLDDFIYDAIRWQKIVAESSSNTFYLYKFTCKSDLNMMSSMWQMTELLGPGPFVAHADDLMYLFPPKLYPIKLEMDSREFRMIETVTTLWTNFAKYGNPTPDNSLGVTWAPYTTEEQNYMDVGEQLVPGTEPELEHVQFWEDIYREYLPERLPRSSASANYVYVNVACAMLWSSVTLMVVR